MAIAKRPVRWADHHEQPLTRTKEGFTEAQLMGRTGFQDTTLDCPEDQVRRQVYRRLAHLEAVGGAVDPSRSARYRELYELGEMMGLSLA